VRSVFSVVQNQVSVVESWWSLLLGDRQRLRV